MVGVILDVTSRRLAEEERASWLERERAARIRVEETNRALQRLNENLRQFAYAVAHDLKEPLRMVTLYTELLARRYGRQLGSEADRFMETIISGAQRLHTLIDDLLAFTHAGTAAERPPEEVDAQQALAAALRNLSQAVEDSHATVESEPLPVVKAHLAPLTQVFQNLIGNAIKYARPGVPPRIRVCVSQDETHWVFSVTDNGIGIPSEYYSRIFGVFRRLHKDRPGTGIGLAICQRVAEAYGGTIRVSSDEATGSTFTFTLAKVPPLAER
jgi:light-regulated signal transduction histidine kinase (bacteriophytochrome)